MAHSSDSVVIGNGPDFAMRLGADELSHTFSFVVSRPDSAKSNFVPSGVSSDRSLAKAVEILKQKLTPYGWTKATMISWDKAVGLAGTFDAKGREVVFEYRFHERLEMKQRDVLEVIIVAFFRIGSGNSKTEK
jgi:hypothetical protein